MAAVEHDFDGALTRGSARRANQGRGTRHHLTVMACDTADAVVAAGGLIFDRVGTGWNVKVFIAERMEERPLRILGVTARQLSDGIAPAGDWPDAIVVAAALYTHDVRVRHHVDAAAHQRSTEIAIWGDDWPATLDSGIGLVEHRLSIAAQAFKVHAMAAAGAAPGRTSTEQFWSGKRRLSIAAPMVPS